jgi:hypothetical protein
MHLPGMFLHNRTLEYPVSAKAIIGRLLPCRFDVATHKAVTPSVKSIGSRKSQIKPRLCLPYLVNISRIKRAAMILTLTLN